MRLTIGLGLVLGLGCAPEAPTPVPASEATRGISPGPELVLKDRAAEAARANSAQAHKRAPFDSGQRFGEPAFGEAPRAHDRGAERRLARPIEDGDPCGRCGGDVGCRLLCFAGEAEVDAGGELDFDCLECGRETGFLGRPEMHVEFLEDGDVRLYWEAVPGAARYIVHGFRWLEDTEDSASMHASTMHPTTATEVVVPLDRHYVHAFYVVAWSADRKLRSLPSEPVRIEPDP